MMNKIRIGLAAAALVLAPPAVGTFAKAGTEGAGGQKMGEHVVGKKTGGDHVGGRHAAYLKHKPSGHAKHEPVTYGYSKAKAKAKGQ
jgi:hypothetical protein